jgi:apolipoprotein N-acyltransferase
MSDAGDVSDVNKIAFLRALAGEDRMLGVAWYYPPNHDGRSQGRRLEWRDKAAWQTLDDELYTVLATLPEHSVAALEQVVIWPEGALFHRQPVPFHRLRSA